MKIDERFFVEQGPNDNWRDRDEALRVAILASVGVPGHIVEFGVWEGDSTRFILSELERYNISKRVYACDSFEGLPEPYEQLEAGYFKCDVPLIPGARIVKGWFEDTLTDKLAHEVGQVAFASLDADLYSSTKAALTWLTPLLSPNSLLLFDEYLGNGGGEQRAHEEWMESEGVQCEEVLRHDRYPVCKGGKEQRVLFRVKTLPTTG